MLIKLKPNTPGQRGTVLVSKKHLSTNKPVKFLTKPIKSTGGRNKVLKTLANLEPAKYAVLLCFGEVLISDFHEVYTMFKFIKRNYS